MSKDTLLLLLFPCLLFVSMTFGLHVCSCKTISGDSAVHLSKDSFAAAYMQPKSHWNNYHTRIVTCLPL